MVLVCLRDLLDIVLRHAAHSDVCALLFLQKLEQDNATTRRQHVRCPNQSEHRKRKHVVDSLEELFSLIKRVFAEGGPIKQVAVLLGSTIVTPKEVLLLHFPTAFYEGPVLSLKSCISSLFKTLVSGDFQSAAKTMNSSAKLTVLMLAARHCDFAPHRMLYKPHFKVPARGQHLMVNFHCTSGVAPAELSRLDETDVDISGIEPLPMYTPGVSPGGGSCLNSGHSSVGSCAASNKRRPRSHRGSYCAPPDRRRSSLVIPNHDGFSVTDGGVDDEAEPVEYVWYQFPVTTKGYVGSATS